MAQQQRANPRLELRNFLRAARSRVDPIQSGIPSVSRRRRKPGLRIEELCALAGVSDTWYSALERGRPVSVSRRMLEAISGALQLNADERHYLIALTQYQEPDASTSESTSIRATLARLVHAIEFGPSMLVDERWNVHACNRIAQVVYSINATADGPDNLAVRMFLDDAYRSLHVDWAPVAQAMVAILKMNYAFSKDQDSFDGFIKRMVQSSGEFEVLWGAAIVSELRPKIMRLNHQILGALQLESIGLDQSERWRVHADDTLLVQVPVPGTGTVESLQRALL